MCDAATHLIILCVFFMAFLICFQIYTTTIFIRIIIIVIILIVVHLIVPIFIGGLSGGAAVLQLLPHAGRRLPDPGHVGAHLWVIGGHVRSCEVMGGHERS